ncbi:hypothetical protein [Gordonia phage MerCougar]|nr:hypothetical protein [Gordonia phage MerCougar]
MTLTHVVTVRDTVTLRRDTSATGYVGAIHPDGITVRVSWEGGAGVSTVENIADLFYILPAEHVGERHTVDLRPGVPTACGAGVFTWTDEYGDEYAGNCAHPAGHTGDCAVSVEDVEDVEVADVERCVVCAQEIDYCSGHGEIGDPFGAAVLVAHDNGDHKNCAPYACDETPVPAVGASVLITDPSVPAFHATVTAADETARTVDVSLFDRDGEQSTYCLPVRDVVEITK